MGKELEENPVCYPKCSAIEMIARHKVVSLDHTDYECLLIYKTVVYGILLKCTMSKSYKSKPFVTVRHCVKKYKVFLSKRAISGPMQYMYVPTELPLVQLISHGLQNN